jgi:hypothetical protein
MRTSTSNPSTRLGRALFKSPPLQSQSTRKNLQIMKMSWNMTIVVWNRMERMGRRNSSTKKATEH